MLKVMTISCVLMFHYCEMFSVFSLIFSTIRWIWLLMWIGIMCRIRYMYRLT